MSDRPAHMSSIDEQMRFESLLAELSAGFINLPAEQVDATVEDAQRRVCECLGLDLAVLWQWEVETPGVFTLTHYYRRLDGPPISSELQASELWPWSLRQIQANRSVLIASTEDDVMEGAERDQESFRHFGVKSLLLIPLSTGGRAPFGAISFSDMATARNWSEALVKRLELVAQIFANAIVRRRYEQTLRETNERLALAADSAGAGLWSLELASGCFWVTKTVNDQFGFSVDDPVTLDRVLEATLPEDRALLRQALDEVVATGQEGRVEYRIVRPDGSIRWMVSRGRVHGPPGKPATHLMGVTIDVTDAKNTEESLKQNEFRLTSAVDIAGLGFYEVANGENVTYLDPRACALVGLPEHEPPDGTAFRFWIEHLDAEDRTRILELHRRLNEGKLDQITTEFRYSHPDRGQIWLQILSHVVQRDAAGHALQTIGVFRDITAQKTAEQEAQRVQFELAHAMRVSMLGELAASMAHELNQPLAAILSNAQAARRFLAAPNPDLKEIREILDDIVKDDKRAGEVIHHVRAMMQKKAVASAPLDVNELVNDISQLLRSELIGRNMELITDLAPALPSVWADQVEIQQILINLMVNAMDAMRDQPVERRQIHIHTSMANNRVCVAVRDCGTGIAEKDMEEIFRPFFTTKTHGLGLGLAISRTMVESHGGKLWAQNDAAGGAIFWVEFPVREEARYD